MRSSGITPQRATTTVCPPARDKTSRPRCRTIRCGLGLVTSRRSSVSTPATPSTVSLALASLPSPSISVSLGPYSAPRQATPLRSMSETTPGSPFVWHQRGSPSSPPPPAPSLAASSLLVPRRHSSGASPSQRDRHQDISPLFCGCTSRRCKATWTLGCSVALWWCVTGRAGTIASPTTSTKSSSTYSPCLMKTSRRTSTSTWPVSLPTRDVAS
mmetsp:Transcript_1784/g.5016  ORF Transcript_1784/g.5016 Transcript_1784/m.5016 type:complete len:214 (+) Transcript_1784:92-733(+)